MTPMKLFSLMLGVLFVAGPLARGQVIVNDPVAIETAMINHVQEILKLVAMIEQLQATKDWLGHASEIVNLAGLEVSLHLLDEIQRLHAALEQQRRSNEGGT